MLLNENLFKEWVDDGFDWEQVASKQLEDSDGFMTDYTWYKRILPSSEEQHIFIFGDSDLYGPDDSHADAEFDSYKAAEDWFNSYNGFADDLDESVNKNEKSQYVSGRYVYFKYKQVEGMTAEQLAKSIEKAYREKFRDEIKVTHIEKHSYDFSNKEIPYIV